MGASHSLWKGISETERIRFGDLAVARGKVDAGVIAQALEKQSHDLPRRKIGQILIEDGRLSTADCADLLLGQEELAGTELHQRISRFLLLHEIGRGGMGVVWRAWDTRLARPVAIKMLNLTRGSDPAHLLKEAQTAARLSHPNIVPIYEILDDIDSPCIVMGLVEGDTLGDVAPKLPLRRILEIVAQAARAVHYAHSEGVVHRDLKPENLMLDRDGKVYVMDFGLAKVSRAGAAQSVSGAVLGTPVFMSPEQAMGQSRRVGSRSDVYGLGATLYALAGGDLPFRASSPAETMRMVIESDPAPLRSRRAGVPIDVETIVHKAMRKAPEERYPTAAAFADDLDRFLRGEPIEARPVSTVRRVWRRARRHGAMIAMGCVVAVSLVAFAVALLRPHSPPLRSGKHLEEVRALVAQAALFPENVSELLAQARREADDAISADPRSGEGHALRARIAELEGDDPRVGEHFVKALELEPDHAAWRAEWAEYRLERRIWELENVEFGEPAFRFAATVKAEAADLTRAQPDGLARAALATAQGRFADALACCDDSPGASRLRVFLLLQLGRDEEASAEMERAIRIWPRDPRLAVLHTLVLDHAGKNEDAAREIQQAALRLGRHPKVLLLRAKMTYRSVRWDDSERDREILGKAKMDCQAALALDPLDPEVHWWLATCMAPRGNQEAWDAYGRTIQLARETGRPWVEAKALRNRGYWVNRQWKKFEDAKADLDEAARLDPTNPAIPHDRARLLGEMNDRSQALVSYATAEELYTGYLASAPWFRSAWKGRAECRLALKKWDGAMDDVEKAVRKEEWPTEFYGIGAKLMQAWAASKDSDLQQGALQAFTRSLQWDSEGVDALDARGRLHAMRGHWKEALADLERAVKLDPTRKPKLQPWIDQAERESKKQ